MAINTNAKETGVEPRGAPNGVGILNTRLGAWVRQAPSFLIVLVFIFLGSFAFVQAQEREFPIWALGGCRDRQECFLYCEIPQNKAACWSYGKYVAGENVLGESDRSDAAMEEQARIAGITFPVAELGNCANTKECRAFCDNPANKSVCIEFSRKHGFNKEKIDQNYEQKKQELMLNAGKELGCTNRESCKELCQIPQNQERCRAFAQKYGFVKPEPSPSTQPVEKQKILEMAKTELGCNSYEECKQVCEKDKARCVEFSKKVATEKRMQENKDSRQEIMKKEMEKMKEKYRQNQQQTNDVYKNSATPSASSVYVGPLGCKTSKECEEYCKADPTKCPGFEKRMEELKKQMEYKKQENYLQPTVFQQKFVPYISPSTGSSNTNYQKPENYTPPQNTDYKPQGDYNPEAKCKAYGCNWDGQSCKCN